METAAHLHAQLKHISAALSEVEKSSAELTATRAALGRAQVDGTSLADALDRKNRDYSAAYATCTELRDTLDATERTYSARLRAEQALGASRAADSDAVLARRESLIADLAAANSSLELQLADSQVEVQALTRRTNDLQHVLDAYRREQARSSELEELVAGAHARSTNLEATLASMGRENDVLRALCEENMGESGRLRAELLHTRGALVDVTMRRPYLNGHSPSSASAAAAAAAAAASAATTAALLATPSRGAASYYNTPRSTASSWNRAAYDRECEGGGDSE